MKDGALKTCVGMVMIGVVYATYMVFSPDPEDGVVFGSVVAAMAALAGYQVGVKKAAA